MKKPTPKWKPVYIPFITTVITDLDIDWTNPVDPRTPARIPVITIRKIRTEQPIDIDSMD